MNKNSILTITNKNDKLYGILTEPYMPNKSDVTIVFLHGWAGYRIGPHRMFVEYSRVLSDMGFHCIRFDFRGKGFSTLNGETNNKTMVEDVESIIEYIDKNNLPSKIILLGICSGAKIALYYALHGSRRIEHNIELSTSLLWLQESSQAELLRSKLMFLDYLKKFFRKETWIKIYSAKVNYKQVIKLIVEPLLLSLKSFVKKGNSIEQKDRSQKTNKEKLFNFKGEILAFHGENDPETKVALSQLQIISKKYLIQLHTNIIKGANHSFYSVDWKEDILCNISDWLSTKYSLHSK